MIPISDELSTKRFPLVTIGLIGINGLVFAYELLLGPGVDALIMDWGVIPAHLTNLADHPSASVTLLTSMFLHGGWAHLLGNMLYLWIFGDNVEDRLGRLGYLLFYVVAGVAAGVAQVLAGPTSETPGIGASGAVAGVLGVYLVLYPKAPVRALVPGLLLARLKRVPAALVLGMWFVLQLFNGALALGSTAMLTGGVAWFAHIGGFVVGLAVGLVLRAFQRRRTYWR